MKRKAPRRKRNTRINVSFEIDPRDMKAHRFDQVAALWQAYLKGHINAMDYYKQMDMWCGELL